MGLPGGDSWWMSVPEVVDHAWSVKRFERGLSTPDARLHQGGEPTRGRPARTRRAGGNRRPALRNRLGGPGGRPSQSPAGFERWRWSPAPAASRDVRTWSLWPVRVRHGLTEIEEALLDPRGAKVARIRHGASPSSANLHQLIRGSWTRLRQTRRPMATVAIWCPRRADRKQRRLGQLGLVYRPFGCYLGPRLRPVEVGERECARE